MTHDDFFAGVKQGDVRCVYLFEGEEEHIKGKALQALRGRLLPEGLEALNESVLQNPSADTLIAAAETLPVMAERRLVVVRDSALLSAGKAANEADDSQKLAGYLLHPPETACIVFYCHKALDGRKKLTQALGKTAAVVTFDRLGDPALARWMQQQLRPLGKTISYENTSFLAFTAGRDLLTLTQELAKLSAYAGDREEIGQADIEAVVTPSLECTVFQLVDALVAGKEAEAFGLLGAMLENGEARVGILAMMARQYRNLLHLKLMAKARVPEAEIQKQLGVPPFAMRRLAAQARAADEETLASRLRLCVDTDYAIKSGKIREDAALERVMLRLCSRQS
ncbi:MAG: DNA polymerase III subunit delta [Firmicutes bacterium]|nr:DNA polymerase III subunit delta [Bacillota bacterium]